MAEAQPTGAANLMSLPTEVLDQIARRLSRPELYALALTCRKTKKSAIDVLYKAYQNREPPAKAPFYLFLRTICERPTLAVKVKRVDIRGWRSEYEFAAGKPWRGLMEKRGVEEVERNGPVYTNTEKVVRSSTAEMAKHFVNAATAGGLIAKPATLSVSALKSSMVWYTSLKEDNDFLRLLVRGAEDAQVVLMLALLPSLKVLYIDGMSPYPLLDWYTFLSRSKTALRALSTLCIVGSVLGQNEPVVKNTLQFMDVMPNLQQLGLFNVAAGGHDFAMNMTLPSRKLDCIILETCSIDARLLRKIVDGQELSRFAYEAGFVQIEAVSGELLAVMDIITLLASSKNCLEKLAVFPAVITDEPSSLMMFKKLEELEILQPGILNIPLDELDPEAIASHLCEQIPHTLSQLHLRYLKFDQQTKVVLQLVAQLKRQGILPALSIVHLNFINFQPSVYVVGPIGGFASNAQTGFVALPRVEAPVREELGKLYGDAGIELVVEQTDGIC
ncbi:hypothetical protein BDW02DRAFT_551522 [Decorospora gaudefroyi]|uniref:F-box domain-containing protein n=1 Tax=Decorospora gaudefroyi TaxID=184978 RepID=A0A6A5KFA3_9PLEO|nr:hypothetical protein BDW02DRAFT_551522 [Decorospora gaudefroyi]